jgi:hypothetical protein
LSCGAWAPVSSRLRVRGKRGRRAVTIFEVVPEDALPEATVPYDGDHLLGALADPRFDALDALEQVELGGRRPPHLRARGGTPAAVVLGSNAGWQRGSRCTWWFAHTRHTPRAYRGSLPIRRSRESTAASQPTHVRESIVSANARARAQMRALHACAPRAPARAPPWCGQCRMARQGALEAGARA